MVAPSIDVVRHWRNLTVIGTDGVTIGRIAEIYLDDRDDQPRWALVGSMAAWGNLVPIAEAVEHDDWIHVPYDSRTVIRAPGMPPAGGLSEEEEEALHRHYGLSFEPRPFGLAD
ncbi:MAG TPA: PRC-barrel domain-containing protein [Actinomycetes bacterium]|nr:PRC-barrel domain-containing protein [Actinomycetes bacterium]